MKKYLFLTIIISFSLAYFGFMPSGQEGGPITHGHYSVTVTTFSDDTSADVDVALYQSTAYPTHVVVLNSQGQVIFDEEAGPGTYFLFNVPLPTAGDYTVYVSCDDDVSGWLQVECNG
jgi:hypothetical protein